MPRKITLSQVTLDSTGRVHMTFEQQLVDGDLTVTETNVRRIISPGEDAQTHFADLESYWKALGYPKIIQHDKDIVHGLLAMAGKHPGIAANAKAYAKEQEALSASMPVN